MTIKVPAPTKKAPAEAGYYIAYFSFAPQLISIVNLYGELRQLTGPNSTHFTKWKVLWSEKLELF